MENANDEITWKSRLQSKTVRAVILAAIVSVVNAYIAVSGNQIDIDTVQFWSDAGLQFIGEGVTLGLLWKAYKGRMAAKTEIKPLPWHKEVKTLIKKEK